MAKSNSKTTNFQAELEQVVHALRKDVYSGQRLPRERLVEKDLSDSYGVNRMVVRQALSKLEAEGLVTLEAYRGASVAEISLEGIRESYQVVGMLEGYAAGLACPRLTPQDLQKLGKNLAKQKDVLLENVNRWQELNIGFHRTINLNCGNRRLIDLIRQNSTFRSYWFIVLSVPGRISTNLKEHEALLGALQERNSESARAIMEKHLLGAGEYLVEFLRKNVPIGIWREGN